MQDEADPVCLGRVEDAAAEHHLERGRRPDNARQQVAHADVCTGDP